MNDDEIYDATDDEYDVITPEQYRADVLEAARELAAEAGVEYGDYEQGQEQEGWTEEDADEFILGKLQNLQKSLGRDVTSKEVERAVDTLVNDPDSDLDPKSFEVDLSNDEQRVDHFVELVNDTQVDQGQQEAVQ